MNEKITVFTPVYNRAYCITKLYNSLKKQTYKNFEWIVIDDGSTDNIDQLFNVWIKEIDDFNIIYVKVKNGGKMKAVNQGIKLATAPAFFIVDSDDYLTDDALEYINIWFSEIQNDNNFAGVSGLRKIKTVDAQHNFNYIDATNIERHKFNLNMDMAECYKTDILKKYPSPEIVGENYISPSIVWNRIAQDGYKLRWHNKVIYNAEYRPDGLTMAGPGKFIKNPIGWGKLIQVNIACKKDIEYAEFQNYLYYKSLKDMLSFEQIVQNLGIKETELKDIIAQKPNFINKINQYFCEKKIRRIALYGMGFEAKRFLQISDEFDIEICYGIDKHPNSLLPICYEPTNDLPEVDLILITNLRGYNEIKEELKMYTNIRVISMQKDIIERGFRYYFSDI